MCLFFIIITASLLRGSTGQSVKQTAGILTVTEGQSVDLHCTYEASFTGTHYPFWYIQSPGQTPKFLLDSYLKTAEGFEATHNRDENKKKGTFNIRKANIQLKDSAVYFCAFEYQGLDKTIFGSGTRLLVMPNLRNSTPSVYQLETKENLTACLITDYSPNSIKVKDHNNMKTVDGSVVVVKDDHENPTSLGAVIWRQKKDQFQCSVEHSGLNYKAENEGDGCSETQSSTPVFETDERLNLLSLTVLGLRLIFFKSVALNLILTFWAWSR